MISKKKFLLIVLLSLFVLIIGTWISIEVTNRQGKKEIVKFISTVNRTTLQGVHSWAERHYAEARQEAYEQSFLINELVTQTSNSKDLIDSPIQKQLYSDFSTLFLFEDYKGYDIISKDNIFLSTSEIDRIGKRNVRYNQKDVLGRIWNGKTVISNPFYVNNNRGGKTLVMFVGTPVKNDSNIVTAIVLFTINPLKNFTKIFEQGRIGDSGENYAIDKTGKFVSKIRFSDQLIKSGLIKSDKSEILNPSIQSVSPMFFSGKKRTFSSDFLRLSDSNLHYHDVLSSANLKGYIDYKGVNVVGVWTWDKELDLWFVTEISVKEAYLVFNKIQTAILILLFIWIIVFILVSVIIYNWYKSLVKKEKTYEDLFNNSPLGIYQTTPNDEIKMVNQTLLDMMGYDSLSDLQTLNLEKEGYSEESSLNHNEFKEIIERDGFVKGIEGSWKTREGEILYVRENARIVRDKNGKTLCYEGIVEDISEKKKAEIELKSQKEFLKTVIDINPNLVFVKDWHGRFTLVNKKMAELFGQSIEEMIGKTELDINPNKKEAENFLKDDREVMTTLQSKIISEELFISERTGEKHWFHTTKVPLILSNGESRQVLGVVTDITKQKQTEETIRQVVSQFLCNRF
tara:strand:- start:11 stop:1891 length:1881 start_codon:yes stop_codon:yes gene_type:complete